MSKEILICFQTPTMVCLSQGGGFILPTTTKNIRKQNDAGSFFSEIGVKKAKKLWLLLP